MPIISIQSSVAYGHVGNSAAVFAMQRLGAEVWPVHTVQLSNHTGYPDWGGGALGAAHVAEVLAGVERRGGFTHAAGLLSGYAGNPDLVAVIADAVGRLKTANPKALFCCDPVLGNDVKGLFVAEEVAVAIKEKLLCRADIATPNRFELAWLTGATIDTVDQARTAADQLAAHGPAAVVVSSLPTNAGIGVLVRDNNDTWLIETPHLDVVANGAGDCFTAMMLARLVGGAPIAEAAAKAVSSIFGLLSRSDGGELPIVTAQDEIVAPGREFVATPLE